VVICLKQGADCLHMVQLMPLHPKPHHLWPRLNPDWFYLSGTSLPRLSWKKAVKRVQCSSFLSVFIVMCVVNCIVEWCDYSMHRFINPAAAVAIQNIKN